MSFSAELLKEVRQVATELSPATVETLVRFLDGSNGPDASLRQAVLGRVPTPGGRFLVGRLLEVWGRHDPPLPATALAAALAASAYCGRAAREELSVELVWTGPTEDVPLRLTSQVLLQLIKEAREEILIVSFAFYNIPEVVEALSTAITQGRRLKIVAETPDESEGKVAYGALSTLGDKLVRQSQVYFWPKDKRPVDSQGRHGTLHVKCAVADDDVTYITSANLTGYAMRLNMELGTLIRSKEFARQAKEHIEGLIFKGVLVPLKT